MEFGFAQLLILAFIAVMILGPKEAHRIAHTLGRWLHDVRKLSRDFSAELRREAELVEWREKTLAAEKKQAEKRKEFKEEDLRNYHAVAAAEPATDAAPESAAGAREPGTDS